MGTSYKDVVSALTDAIQNLSQAYGIATDADDKDRIFSMMEMLQDEVNAVSSAGLAVSDSVYQAQTDSFRNSADQLNQFKAKIDQYINNVALISSVADSLTKIIGLLA